VHLLLLPFSEEEEEGWQQLWAKCIQEIHTRQLSVSALALEREINYDSETREEFRTMLILYKCSFSLPIIQY
jgi:hypothetical protein